MPFPDLRHEAVARFLSASKQGETENPSEGPFSALGSLYSFLN